MGIFNPNPGSWLKLPDYGITETLGSLFSGGQTRDLSQALTPSKPSASTSSVLGTSTPAPQSYQPSGGGFGSLLSQPTGGGVSQQQPQQQQQNPFQDMGNASFDQAQADLNNALTEFDRVAAEAELQKTSALGQKEGALSEIGAQEQSATKRAGTLTSEAEESATTEKQRALSTSQDVERKNRNMLRALGILSSSAAGEMLAKPGEEYAKTSADVMTAFQKRKTQVDDWLSERIGEADRAKNDIVKQFNDIIGRIDSDIRFTGRDKINAVQSAQAALKENIAQLNQQAMSYQQAAQQYSQNMATQIAQLQLYQNPSANVSGILSSLMQPQTSSYKPVQVGTLQPEKEDKYGTLSGY